MRDGLTVEDWELLWNAARKNRFDASAACSSIYRQYLRSDLWLANSQPAWNRSHGRCERCKLNRGDNAHHLHYSTRFRERPEDLQILCRGCHDFVHELSDVDPKDWRTAKQKEFWHVGEAA